MLHSAFVLSSAKRGVSPGPHLALLNQRAETLIAQLGAVSEITMHIVPSVAEIGGGSCAGYSIPSVALSLRASGTSPEILAQKFRMSVTAIWCRIESDAVLLDLRSIDPRDDQWLCQVMKSVITAGPASP